MAQQLEVNIRGKVVVPTPDLIRCMATKKMSVDDSRAKKSLYAIAFSSLVRYLRDGVTITKNSDGSWNYIPSKEYKKYLGYAILDSFETFHLVPCSQSVKFTLGPNSNWVREYDFGMLSNNSSDNQLNALKLRGHVTNNIQYYTLEVPDGMSKQITSYDQDLINHANAKNFRTSNAFLYKFGVKLENPDLQSWIDSSVNLIESFDGQNIQ